MQVPSIDQLMLRGEIMSNFVVDFSHLLTDTHLLLWSPSPRQSLPESPPTGHFSSSVDVHLVYSEGGPMTERQWGLWKCLCSWIQKVAANQISPSSWSIRREASLSQKPSLSGQGANLQAEPGCKYKVGLQTKGTLTLSSCQCTLLLFRLMHAHTYTGHNDPHSSAARRACESAVGGDSLALHSCVSCWCASLMTNLSCWCVSCCSDPANRMRLTENTPALPADATPHLPPHSVILCYGCTDFDSGNQIAVFRKPKYRDGDN